MRHCNLAYTPESQARIQRPFRTRDDDGHWTNWRRRYQPRLWQLTRRWKASFCDSVSRFCKCLWCVMWQLIHLLEMHQLDFYWQYLSIFLPPSADRHRYQRYGACAGASWRMPFLSSAKRVGVFFFHFWRHLDACLAHAPTIVLIPTSILWLAVIMTSSWTCHIIGGVIMTQIWGPRHPYIRKMLTTSRI